MLNRTLANDDTPMTDETVVLFWREPEEDDAKTVQKILNPDTGPYMLFRRLKTPLQERFSQLMDHNHIPRCFIHGSAHIDNYAKTLYGAGIVDFDRAHIGPYGWDLVCVLLALGLRNPDTLDSFVDADTVDALHRGYLKGFHNPAEPYTEFQALANVEPKKWEQSTRAYLKAEKKWAKQLKQCAIEPEHPLGLALLNEYLHNGNYTQLLQSHRVDRMAYCSGTFGRPRFLYALLANNDDDDDILIDIKHTKNYIIPAWPHTRFYTNAYGHQGKRMVAAAKHFAPDCCRLESWATINGIEYWGRQVPTLNRKPAKQFTREQQADFAFAAGTQLGRAHQLGPETSAADILQHFQQHYQALVATSQQLQSELMAAWTRYSARYQRKDSA